MKQIKQLGFAPQQLKRGEVNHSMEQIDKAYKRIDKTRTSRHPWRSSMNLRRSAPDIQR